MFVVDKSRIVTLASQKTSASPIARELRRCLSQALGQSLPIVTGEPEDSGILLTMRPELVRPSDMGSEVVAWRCDGKSRLEISGSNEHSLWLAVYAFLMEHAGCRWFFPGKLGEDIPKLKHLRLGRLNAVHRPSYVMRDWRVWPRTFQRPMLGSEGDLGIAHAWYTIVPAEVAREHPEYTSMLNGRRRGERPYQLCTSQQGVEDLAVQYCLDWFKANPDAPSVSLCPNDTDMFCDCPKCVATNLGPKARPAKNVKPPRWVSRSVYEFANRVAARVSKVHPDKLLIVNAYGRTEKPPHDLTLHDNVLAWYATWAIKSPAPAAWKKMDEDIGGWCKVGRHVAIYEYLVNQSWPGLPRPIPTQVARCLKRWHRQGVRYYYSQHAPDFGMNLPNYHVAASLCWDIRQSPSAILDDLYTRCFRKAAAGIRDYYEILEKAVMAQAKRGAGPGALGVTGHERLHEQLQIIYPPQVLAEADAAIARAKMAAAGDDLAARRVKVVADGLKLLRAAVAASAKTYQFEQTFFVPTLSIRPWHIGNYDYDSAVEKLHLYGERCVDGLDELIRDWRDYDRLRRRLARTPTVAEFYSRGASFNPLKRLENIRKLYNGESIDVAPKRAAETRVV